MHWPYAVLSLYVHVHARLYIYLLYRCMCFGHSVSNWNVHILVDLTHIQTRMISVLIILLNRKSFLKYFISWNLEWFLIINLNFCKLCIDKSYKRDTNLQNILKSCVCKEMTLKGHSTSLAWYAFVSKCLSVLYFLRFPWCIVSLKFIRQN